METVMRNALCSLLAFGLILTPGVLTSGALAAEPVLEQSEVRRPVELSQEPSEPAKDISAPDGASPHGPDADDSDADSPKAGNPDADGATLKEISPGIVVRGERLPKKAINRYIYNMLRPQAIGQTGQYPRLRRPFCPSVLGFGEDANEAIKARMRLVAKAAGIQIEEDANCEPNMHLVRVEDGPKTIKMLRKKRPRSAFGWMPLHERTRIERLDGPAYAWQQVFQYSAEGGLPVASTNAPGLFDGAPVNFVAPGCSSPRLCLPAELSFRHSFVLIERNALDDVDVIQMADYALMRGLARVREDQYRADARGADTILNLFDETVPNDERMPSISRMDFAMLTSLYSVAGNVNAHRQRGRMVATFQQVLDALE